MTIHSLTNALHPIILAPGWFASSLIGQIAKDADIDPACIPKDGKPFRLHFDEKYLAKYGPKCYMACMELFYDSKTHTSYGRRGVDVRTYMDLDFVETTDESKIARTYKEMVEFFETTMGYEKNVTIFGAPYDFRKGPLEPETREYCTQLKLLIINAYNKNQGRKVIMMYHSMGSVMVRHCFRYYSQQFKDKYVLVIISIAGVYGGNAASIDIATVTDFMKNFTSTPWVCSTEQAYGNAVIAQTRLKNYTSRDLREYFKDLAGDRGVKMFDDSYKYALNQPTTGVKMYCLRGYNLPTFLTTHFDSDKPSAKISGFTFGDGDGVLNIQGSNCGILKRGSAKDKPIKTIMIKNVDHVSIVKRRDVLERIARIIRKETAIKRYK